MLKTSKIVGAIKIWGRRRAFTIGINLAFCFLALFIVFGIRDFFVTSIERDSAARSAEAGREMDLFITGLSDRGGFPLLVNNEVLGPSKRPLSVVIWPIPFFTYFLNSQNSRTFNAETVRWAPPEACYVSFGLVGTKENSQAAGELRACFAVLRDQSLGRYLYFSFIYPDRNVVRYVPDMPMGNADHIRLDFQLADKKETIYLAFQAPPIASSTRNAAKQFKDIHLLTAFRGSPLGPRAREIGGQAISQQRINVAGELVQQTTILGRLDLLEVVPAFHENVDWPPTNLRDLRIGATIFDGQANELPAQSLISIDPSMKGTSSESIERLYARHVDSGNRIAIVRKSLRGKSTDIYLWDSATATDRDITAATKRSVVDSVLNWVLPKLPSAFGLAPQSRTENRQVDGFPGVQVQLTRTSSDSIFLVVKAIFWLTMTLLFVGLLYLLVLKAMVQIRKITFDAKRMTDNPELEGALKKYTVHEHELGALARSFDLLLARTRRQATAISRRKELALRRKEEEAHVARDQLRAREAVLAAIGHEIRSPLQSLSAIHKEGTPGRALVDQMQLAVKNLYGMATVEAAIANMKVQAAPRDLAAYMALLGENLASSEFPFAVYRGPTVGVFAIFDPDALQSVLFNVLSNAKRHRNQHSQVVIKMTTPEPLVVEIEISNEGPQIAADLIEKIFEYGMSTSVDVNSQGFGLYSAFGYMSAMGGSIKCNNVTGGVVFTLRLQKKKEAP